MNKRGLIFKTIAGKKPRTNVFDLSHEKKLSMNMSNLTPIFCAEVLPGEKWRGSTELYIKLAPMIAPIMHRVNAYVHFFHVPNRLVHENWQNYITGGVDGKNNNYVPRITIDETTKNHFDVGTLADYFGIPPFAGKTMTNSYYINALPFRAYQLIYNEYYRDQTLTPEVTIEKTDAVTGAETQTITTLRKRQWEKDYYTSALNKTQRGDDVNIPMDINYKDFTEVYAQGPGQTPLTTGGQVSTVAAWPSSLHDGDEPLKLENIQSLGATINDLRTSIRLQEWLEKNARAGSRYIEQILAHFGVAVPDYRLQRPELIGRGKQAIMISEVLANMEGDTTPLGKMAGHGVSMGSGNTFQYHAKEHGYIIGILSVLPRTAYYQGIPKMFDKRSRFDFAFPEFAHLGEEPVYSQELFADGGTVPNSKIFGYQSRYSSYKYIPDSVHGEFRTSLEYWHLARKFAAEPLLNASFTEADPSTRIFAVQDPSVQKLWVQLYNNVRAIRPLPVYGTPTL